MTTTTILSDNGVISGTAGIKTTGGNDGTLQLQTTTSGGTATTAVTIDTSQNTTLAGYLNAPNTFGFKNRIINGAMMIDQRNAGASVTPSAAAYTLDRWCLAISQASKIQIGQNLGSVTPPSGFKKYLGASVAATATVGATDYFTIYQAVEGFNVADLNWGTAAAQTVTLSFQVYSSVTGTFGGALRNAAANRSYPFSYTVSSANTWTTISLTIAGDQSGTWATDNSIGIQIFFDLGTGATYRGAAGSWAGAAYNGASGTVSLLGTSGATFYITGVQLEKGSTATSFDYRPYGTELVLCQRYCYVVTTSQAQVPITNCALYQPTYAYGVLPFPTQMRTAPTTTFVNPTNWNVTYSGTVASVTLSQGQVTPYATELIGTGSGMTTGASAWFRSNGSTTNQIINSAEL